MRQGQSSDRMGTGRRRPGSTSNSIQMLSESKVIVSIDSKALEMALVRACTRGAAGVASLSGFE
jgi:ribosomal protein L16/L10AE